MKLRTALLTLIVLPIIAHAAPDAAQAVPPLPALPAFPGAEGAGATTPGGRGGRVLYVTNLDDSGPGSLRAACEAEGPRIVLFQVAGIISLKSAIIIKNPFLTLAGQTAPGDGVCLRGAPLMTATHDVVVRHLRSRLGDDTGRAEDALDVHHGSRDVIFDHCSASWSVDEAFSLSGDNSNITLQYCIIGGALRASIHAKGAHGFGSLSRANGPVSLHHNLYIHNDGRNPRLGTNYSKPPYPVFDFRNNIIYNPGRIASGNTQGLFLRFNYINNLIIPGADTRAATPLHIASDAGSPSEIYLYIEGNIFEGHDDQTADNRLFIDRRVFDGKTRVRVVDHPYELPPVATHPAADLPGVVLPTIGASLPVRDSIDARYINDVVTRGGKIIDSQTELGGWPELKSGPVATDTDGDGMPDAWEIRHGLDPRNPADGAQDADGDGYTNVEEYLNNTNPREHIDYTKAENNVDATFGKPKA